MIFFLFLDCDLLDDLDLDLEFGERDLGGDGLRLSFCDGGGGGYTKGRREVDIELYFLCFTKKAF